jgi:hypothetical protein
MATVAKDQVQRAVQALLTHYENDQAIKAKEAKAKDLIEEDETLSLIITWKKLPKPKVVGKHRTGPLLKPLAMYAKFAFIFLNRPDFLKLFAFIVVCAIMKQQSSRLSYVYPSVSSPLVELRANRCIHIMICC